MYNHTTVWPYDCTRFCPVVQWSVHWALSWMTWVLVLAGARRCALEMCGKKIMWAPLLGLAKSIYYWCLLKIYIQESHIQSESSHLLHSYNNSYKNSYNKWLFFLVSLLQQCVFNKLYCNQRFRLLNPLTSKNDWHLISPYHIPLNQTLRSRE